MTVSHLWPGLTPINVWDMELQAWLLFATAADYEIAEQKKARSAAKRRKR